MKLPMLPNRAAALAALCTLIAFTPILADPQEQMAEAGDDHADMAMETSAEVGAILENLAGAGEKLMALAEATPAENFSWAPNDEVRTISEVYMHVVGTNLLMPSALGAAPPEGLEMTDSPFAMMGEWEKTVTAKDDVTARLGQSLEYVQHALASITDLDTEVTLFGPPAPKRTYFLLLLAHAHEHLGQSIAYARSVGITPPWSQPLPSSEGAGEDGGDG